MRVPRKGEVWDVRGANPQRPDRLVIVSSDEWNETAPPQAVSVVGRHGVAELLPYLVVLHEQADSVAGVVAMVTLGPVAHEDFLDRVGFLGGTTLAKIDTCLRWVYGISGRP